MAINDFNMKENKSKEQIKKSVNKFKLILDSATFALVLSVAFFLYEMTKDDRENKEVISELVGIKNSLTTRYMGVFPEYISSINNLLGEAVDHQKKFDTRDSVVIFQDVLYYGIRSDVHGFKKMMNNLLTLSHYGCHITIAYYDPNEQPFKNMIRDKLVSYEYQKCYRKDIDDYRKRISQFRRDRSGISKELTHDSVEVVISDLINKNFDNYLANNVVENKRTVIENISSYRYVDSILRERYYDSTRLKNPTFVINTIEGHLERIPLYKDEIGEVSARVDNLCKKLDDIEERYLKGKVDDVSYYDFYEMYKEITIEISDMLAQNPNVELIPLRESMMMSCWMIDVNGLDKAVFAFPSKYSTDEIGFISQDIAFSQYIRTMLNGIKLSMMD